MPLGLARAALRCAPDNAKAQGTWVWRSRRGRTRPLLLLERKRGWLVAGVRRPWLGRPSLSLRVRLCSFALVDEI